MGSEGSVTSVGVAVCWPERESKVLEPPVSGVDLGLRACTDTAVVLHVPTILER